MIGISGWLRFGAAAIALAAANYGAPACAAGAVDVVPVASVRGEMRAGPRGVEIRHMELGERLDGCVVRHIERHALTGRVSNLEKAA